MSVVNTELHLERMRRDKANFESVVIEFQKIEFKRVEGLPTVKFQTGMKKDKAVWTSYPLTPEAYVGLVAVANKELRVGLLDQMDDEMANALVNYFLAGLEGQVRLVLGSGEEGMKNIISLIPPSIVVVPDLDVYDSVCSEMESHNLRLVDFIEKSDGHVMRFLADRTEDVRPGVGDVLRSGVEVFNSPSGHAPSWVGSYILRLVCTNGMTRSETTNKTMAQATSPESMLELIRRGVMVALGQFDNDIEQIKQTIEQHVSNPVDMLEAIGQEFSLPQRNVESAIEALEEEPDIRHTLWGVLNAISRVGNNAELGFDSRHKMQSVALRIVNTGLDRCESCGALHRGGTPHQDSVRSE